MGKLPNLWPFPLWDFPWGIRALRCGTHEPLISIPSPLLPCELWLHLTVAGPYERGCSRNQGGVTYGDWFISERSSGDFNMQIWEAESLSPISLSVSMFEVPRRFGHMGKTARSFSWEEASSWPIILVILCNISQADYNKNRGRKACHKRMALISYSCIAFRQHHLDRCLKALRWSSG